MATWLDVLAQNHMDQQGRFNPFSLARGFSSKGRQEIDQAQAIEEGQRQEMLASQAAQQQARQAMTGGQDLMSIQPTSPEQAAILQHVAELMSARQGYNQQELMAPLERSYTQAQTSGINAATAAQEQATQFGREDRPFTWHTRGQESQARELGLAASELGLRETAAGMRPRQSLLESQAATAAATAKEAPASAEANRRILEGEANFTPGRRAALGALIDSNFFDMPREELLGRIGNLTGADMGYQTAAPAAGSAREAFQAALDRFAKEREQKFGQRGSSPARGGGGGGARAPQPSTQAAPQYKGGGGGGARTAPTPSKWSQIKGAPPERRTQQQISPELLRLIMSGATGGSVFDLNSAEAAQRIRQWLTNSPYVGSYIGRAD